MSKLKSAIEAAKRQRETAYAAQSNRAAAGGSSRSIAYPARESRVFLVLNDLRRIEIDRKALEANRILTHDSRHSAEVAYRMLRTRVMRNMRSNDWRVLGVTSIGQNEGKTLTSINLAISIAAEIDQEAVLVDLDLRRPSIYKYLGANVKSFSSLNEFLDGDTDQISNLLVCPSIDRLGALLTAKSLERSSDLLSSARGKEIFMQLREQLSPETVIVVDLPPLLNADDALAVAPMLDSLLLVVAEGQAERNELADARQILQEFNLMGTVLNKSVEKDSKRSSYY